MTGRAPIHPAFPQPADPDARVWRYLSGFKFEWLVTEGRLLMPSTQHLGDPREGSTPAGELHWWDSEADSARSDESRRIIRHNREFISGMAKSLLPHYYVSCWYMSAYENRGIWKAYTAGNDAVAIHTTYALLREALPEPVEMGRVRYIDYAADRLPSMNMFEYIMHKDAFFEFEREVRAVALQPFAPELGAAQFNEHVFKAEANPGLVAFAPLIDVTKLIRGIVFHPEASEHFKHRITALCASHGLVAPVASRAHHPVTF